MTIVYPSPRKPIRYTVVESILPRVLYVLQDAGVARRWRLALRVAVCFARRRRLAAVAVLLQREVAELWEALSGGGTRAGDRCCDIDRRSQSDYSGVRKYAAKAAAAQARLASGL